jgi:hypothetical protein
VKSTNIDIKIEKYIREIESTLIIKIVIIGKEIAAIIAPKET